jgi:hypothetical protein
MCTVYTNFIDNAVVIHCPPHLEWGAIEGTTGSNYEDGALDEVKK